MTTTALISFCLWVETPASAEERPHALPLASPPRCRPSWSPRVLDPTALGLPGESFPTSLLRRRPRAFGGLQPLVHLLSCLHQNSHFCVCPYLCERSPCSSYLHLLARSGLVCEALASASLSALALANLASGACAPPGGMPLHSQPPMQSPCSSIPGCPCTS